MSSLLVSIETKILYERDCAEEDESGDFAECQTDLELLGWKEAAREDNDNDRDHEDSNNWVLCYREVEATSAKDGTPKVAVPPTFEIFADKILSALHERLTTERADRASGREHVMRIAALAVGDAALQCLDAGLKIR